MEERYYMHLNMLGNQIKNGVLEKLSTEPVTGLFEGRIYYNTTSKNVWFYDGTTWQSFWDSNEDVAWLIEQVNIILGELENSDDETIAYILNQIDNIIPGTISDHISNTSNPHGTTLEKARITDDTLAGDINMGQNTVTGLKEPVLDSDDATKAYVDATAQGLKIRKQLDYATTVNLNVNVRNIKYMYNDLEKENVDNIEYKYKTIEKYIEYINIIMNRDGFKFKDKELESNVKKLLKN